MHPIFESCGTNVIIRGTAKFARPSTIRIGNNVIIDDFVFVSGGTPPNYTIIHNWVHIAIFSSILGRHGIEMHDCSGLSPGCRVFSDVDDYVEGALMNPTIPDEFLNIRGAKITMGRFSILGSNTVILAGVEVGEGAVTGACSLVKEDLEPWTVYVGAPARPIKKRNRDEVLKRYEKLLKQEEIRGIGV